MNKANVMKALILCGTGSETCTGCPYYGMNGCDRHMCDDALTLLKTNDKPTYHTAIIYTKRDNLLRWLNSRYDVSKNPHIIEEYAKEREVQLILLVRHEEGKCICRIKCPINPLPIKGEFQCVSTSEMTRLFAYMGWQYKEKIHHNMFR